MIRGGGWRGRVNGDGGGGVKEIERSDGGERRGGKERGRGIRSGDLGMKGEA